MGLNFPWSDLGIALRRASSAPASWVRGLAAAEQRSIDADPSEGDQLLVLAEQQAAKAGVLEEVWGGAEVFGMDYTLHPILPESAAGEDCSDAGFPQFELPDLTQVRQETQECFWAEYGNISRWPQTGCCPLGVEEVIPCSVPSASGGLGYMDWLYHTRILNFESPFNTGTPPNQGVERSWVNPTKADSILYFSALALIAQNMDLVEWVACHVEAWSPEIVDLELPKKLRRLLFSASGRVRPELAVMFVDAADPTDNLTGGPTAWAIVRGDEDPSSNLPVTIIIPLRHALWGVFLSEYAQGGDRALCATTQLAQIILHEMVHVVGDNYRAGKWKGYADRMWSGEVPPYITPAYGHPGTLHDDNLRWDSADDAVEQVKNGEALYPELKNTCWDEARMVASMFVWGMVQRYPCLNNSTACNYMNSLDVFANSILGGG